MDIDVTKKMINSPILKAAIEEAKLSTYKQHKVAAVIFKGKRVIAVAHNQVRSNKIPYRFKNFLESSHAEAHCIIKAKRNLEGYSILVVRLNNQHEIRMAKPCEFCHDFINYVLIKNVYYTTNDGKVMKEVKEQ